MMSNIDSLLVRWGLHSTISVPKAITPISSGISVDLMLNVSQFR